MTCRIILGTGDNYVPSEARNGNQTNALVLDVLNRVDLIIVGESENDTTKLRELIGRSTDSALRHQGSERLGTHFRRHARRDGRISKEEVVVSRFVRVENVVVKDHWVRLKGNGRIE